VTTRRELAAAIGVSGRQGLDDWLTRRTPRSPVQRKIRAWLASTAGNGEDVEGLISPTQLTRDEQGRLAVYLSTSNRRELREQFGATRETLEQAVAGQELAGAIVTQLRAGLDNSSNQQLPG
jgi:hypothetical protein